MQRQQKLLLSFMVWGFVAFYGTTVATALTSEDVAKIALDSTVHLGIFDAQDNLRATGSGFVIHGNQVATNYHVIEDISRGLANGLAKLVRKQEVYRVEGVLAVDKKRDLAIVRVAGIDVPALSLGDSDAVEIGETVYVAGNPQGFEGTFTGGMISAVRPEGIPSLECKVLQMDASVSPGSSGGPVLNSRGEVIGISVAAYDKGRLNLNFAIPVNYLKRLAKLPITPKQVKPKQAKPKSDSPLAAPKAVKPQIDSTKPKPPEPNPHQKILEKGIKLYERAQYEGAIETLSSAVQELEDSEKRAQAYLYLGCSKWGYGESNDQVREQFQESIRHNPDQKLPPRIGENHPIFGELLEEVRRELTGELTITSLLPQTRIWIDGEEIDKKMLGTGTVSRRLLRGDYIVEGIYEGGSKKRTVKIEPNQRKKLDLEIPPIVKHDSPSSISIGEIIPLTLNLISSKGPQQVKINYTIYDRDRNELEQNNQEMRLWDRQPASSAWTYKVSLPSQKHVGSIEYYIQIEYENHLTFRQPGTQDGHYRISIVDSKPPTISLLDPPKDTKITVNQQITIRAEVIDNISVKEVYIHFSPVGSQSQKLSKEDASSIYTIHMTFSQAGSLRYYLIAMDDEGNESKSESRNIEVESPPREPDPIYQGIWASVAANHASTSDWDGGNTFRLAYLSEGKTHPTLGARLEFSHPDRTNISAIAQWGPALENGDIGLTFLGGVAEYENYFTSGTARGSTHMTPILGAGLKFYPQDNIAIDATSSIKVRSDFDTTNLYHYEIGIRFYTTRELSLRAGYGRLHLGDRNISTIQVGLGYTF